MTCPKCQSRMMTLDRMGIHLEQCENCRGIFLDHGELEQISSAEQRYGGGSSATPPPYRNSPRPDSPGAFRGGGYGRGYSDSPRPYGGGHGRGYSDSPRPYGQRKRKKSFMEQLFD